MQREGSRAVLSDNLMTNGRARKNNMVERCLGKRLVCVTKCPPGGRGEMGKIATTCKHFVACLNSGIPSPVLNGEELETNQMIQEE